MKNIYKSIIITIAALWVLFLCALYLYPRAIAHFMNFSVRAGAVNWFEFLILAALIIPSSAMFIKIPNVGEVRLCEVLYYTSFILFNPLLLALLIAVSFIKNIFYKTKKTVKKNTAYLCANSVLVYTSGSFAFCLLKTSHASGADFILQNFPAFMFAAVICYFIKNTLYNINRISSGKAPPYYFWNFHHDKPLINLLIIAPVGFFTGILAGLNLWIFLLFMVPLALIFKTLQNYTTILWEIRESLKIISYLIDRKDPTFAYHSYSVANTAKKIAQELRLNETSAERIYTAGLIHDLGKISVSDQVLRKETSLTHDEYQRVKRHPLVGANLISALGTLSEEAVLIKYHHEHYDGSGYPEGLHREKIPLGARILAVSEAYNTLICGAPYKRKLSRNEALGEIRSSKGLQFDPKIVEALIKVARNEN